MVERDNPASEPSRLVEYEIRERLERHFASRIRWLVLVLVLTFGSLGTLGYITVRNQVEHSALESARSEARDALQAVEAATPDLPQLRQEFRDDAKFIKDQLVTSQVDLQFKLQELLAQAAKFEEAMAEIDEESQKLNSLRTQMTQLQRNIGAEADRLESLRQRYDTELTAFLKESDRLKKAVPAVLDQSVTNFGARVERELDELRTIMADNMAGTPAMFTTWVDLDKRAGQLKGANFGVEPGRVFIRVRAFPREGLDVLGESESILVPLGTWTDHEIELKLSSRMLEQLAEARDKASAGHTSPVLRYGFLVQAADGRMSNWSGKWADSVIPPAHLAIGTN